MMRPSITDLELKKTPRKIWLLFNCCYILQLERFIESRNEEKTIMKKQTIFKKIALSIAAAALLLPLMPTIGQSGFSSNKAEAAATFPDVKDFKAEVSYLTGLEIIRGYP